MLATLTRNIPHVNKQNQREKYFVLATVSLTTSFLKLITLNVLQSHILVPEKH